MAASSVVTLVAAVSAAVYAAGAFRLESDREEKWALAQRRGQAGSIAAWPSVSDYAADEQGRVTGATVFIRNNSELPATNVKVTLRVEASSAAGVDLSYTSKPKEVGLLPPTVGDNDSQWVRVDADRLPVYTLREQSTPRLYAEIQFRDAGGVLWQRTWTGYLRELERSPLEAFGEDLI